MNKKSIILGSLSSLAIGAAAVFAATSTTGTPGATGESGLVSIAGVSAQPVAAVAPSPTAGDVVLPNSGLRTLFVDPGTLKPRAVPYVGGVQTHFAYATPSYYVPEKAAQLVATLGMNSFRDDIFWNAFSPDWDLFGSHLPDELTDFLQRSPAKPLMIVNNGNPFIPGTMPPVTEAARTHFANFAARAAKMTASRGAMYEIWNEWNMNAVLGRARILGAGSDNDPRAARHYAPLAIKASQAIRAQAPGSTILVAASGDDETWDWTREVVKLGALKDADGLSVHMYNHCQAPQLRNATEFIDRLGTLRSSLAQYPDGDKPIYITEWGWPTGTNPCAVDPKDAAKSTAQFLLWTAATPWIGGSWYYQLKDSGRNPNDIQDNFGLYDWDYRSKPASCMAREAMQLINNSRGMTVDRPFNNMFVVKIRTSWGFQIVAWTSSMDKQATLRVGGATTFQARAMCGNDRAISSTREVAIGPTPVVMTFHSNARTALSVRL